LSYPCPFNSDIPLPIQYYLPLIFQYKSPFLLSFLHLPTLAIFYGLIPANSKTFYVYLGKRFSIQPPNMSLCSVWTMVPQQNVIIQILEALVFQKQLMLFVQHNV